MIIDCITNKEYESEPCCMNDYELIIASVEYYKNKACKVAKNNCDACEGRHEYNGKLWCSFDTVIRFIEWDNTYNK